MATATPTLLDAATGILPDVVETRRRLHRRPEMGLQLPETQAVVAEELRGLGLEPQLGGSTTSVTAVIEGARPGPTILLRADMDALPLQEDTGLDFASEVPGVMHACGHDTHVAMLLGAARLLVERRDQLAGNVLLMFQPGEEGFHGARFMLDEGLLGKGMTAASDRTAADGRQARVRHPHRDAIRRGHDRPPPRSAAGVIGQARRHDPRPRRARVVAPPRARSHHDARPSSSWRCTRWSRAASMSSIRPS